MYVDTRVAAKALLRRRSIRLDGRVFTEDEPAEDGGPRGRRWSGSATTALLARDPDDLDAMLATLRAPYGGAACAPCCVAEQAHQDLITLGICAPKSWLYLDDGAITARGLEIQVTVNIDVTCWEVGDAEYLAMESRDRDRSRGALQAVLASLGL